MKTVPKGSYGYIEYRKKSRIIKTLILFVIVAAVYFMGLIVTKTRNNICTVIAILAVLPAARAFVSYLIICRFKTANREHFDKLSALNGSYKLYSDCALSCGDRIVYADFAAVTDNVIYCCMEDKQGRQGKKDKTGSRIKTNVQDKSDGSAFEKSLAGFISSCGDTVEVKLYTDFDAFYKRLGELSGIEFKQNKLERVSGDFEILIL